MVQAAVPLQAMSGSARLAKARERFLNAEAVGPKEVREPILASWRRSRDWSVAADRIDLKGSRRPRSRDLGRQSMRALQHRSDFRVSVTFAAHQRCDQGDADIELQLFALAGFG